MAPPRSPKACQRHVGPHCRFALGQGDGLPPRCGIVGLTNCGPLHVPWACCVTPFPGTRCGENRGLSAPGCRTAPSLTSPAAALRATLPFSYHGRAGPLTRPRCGDPGHGGRRPPRSPLRQKVPAGDSTVLFISVCLFREKLKASAAALHPADSIPSAAGLQRVIKCQRSAGRVLPFVFTL